MDINVDREDLETMSRLHSWARIILKGLKITAGGDAYEFTGSMNEVETLKEVVNEFEATELAELGLNVSEDI